MSSGCWTRRACWRTSVPDRHACRAGAVPGCPFRAPTLAGGAYPADAEALDGIPRRVRRQRGHEWMAQAGSRNGPGRCQPAHRLRARGAGLQGGVGRGGGSGVADADLAIIFGTDHNGGLRQGHADPAELCHAIRRAPDGARNRRPARRGPGRGRRRSPRSCTTATSTRSSWQACGCITSAAGGRSRSCPSCAARSRTSSQARPIPPLMPPSRR